VTPFDCVCTDGAPCTCKAAPSLTARELLLAGVAAETIVKLAEAERREAFLIEQLGLMADERATLREQLRARVAS
jgi:hypothetical protein